MNKAECRGKDPAMFFPERGQHQLANEAMIICMACPVMKECEDYRQRTGSRTGVWAARLHTRKDASEE